MRHERSATLGSRSDTYSWAPKEWLKWDSAALGEPNALASGVSAVVYSLVYPLVCPLAYPLEGQPAASAGGSCLPPEGDAYPGLRPILAEAREGSTQG